MIDKEGFWILLGYTAAAFIVKCQEVLERRSAKTNICRCRIVVRIHMLGEGLNPMMKSTSFRKDCYLTS